VGDTAAPATPTPATPFDTENAIRHAELKKILALGGLATAGGVGLAGVQSLVDLYRRNTTPPRQDAARPRLVRVPYKVAELTATPVATPTLPSATLGDRITSTVQHAIGGVNDGKWGDIQSTIMGAGASGASEMPWTIPAKALAGLGGLYGGYKGMSALLHKSKEEEHKQELERARQEYENALNASAPTIKTASDDDDNADISELLDTLYDQYAEKQATNQAVSALLGTGLTAATLTALLSGAATYNYMKQRDGGDPVRKAIEERQARSVAASPPPIYLVPVPAKSHQDNKVIDAPYSSKLPRKFAATTAPLGAAIGAAMSRDKARQAAAAEQTRLMMGGKPTPPPKPAPAPAAPTPPTAAGLTSLKR